MYSLRHPSLSLSYLAPPVRNCCRSFMPTRTTTATGFCSSIRLAVFAGQSTTSSRTSPERPLASSTTTIEGFCANIPSRPSARLPAMKSPTTSTFAASSFFSTASGVEAAALVATAAPAAELRGTVTDFARVLTSRDLSSEDFLREEDGDLKICLRARSAFFFMRPNRSSSRFLRLGLESWAYAVSKCTGEKSGTTNPARAMSTIANASRRIMTATSL